MKKIISLLPVFIVLVAVNNSNAQGIIQRQWRCAAQYRCGLQTLKSFV